MLTELEEQQPTDAAIVGCFGDPGLDALYEVTSWLPVVGPGEASMHFACMLGRPFGIITVADGVVGPIERVAAHAGLDGRLAGVSVVDTPVLALGENPGETAARASTAARARFRMRHSKTAYPVPGKVAAGSRLSSLLAGPTA